MYVFAGVNGYKVFPAYPLEYLGVISGALLPFMLFVIPVHIRVYAQNKCFS